MPSRTVSIGSRVGLHARPASIFTQAVGQTGLNVTISSPGKNKVNAASILLVMSLAAGHGDQVTLEADGDGAEQALLELGQLLETDLDA